MTSKLLTKATIFAVSMISSPSFLAAQSIDEVKSDVLSALSTPLPITVIGPLLTRDVVVTQEDDGFRATLEDTTLMGLFSFGDVSMKLVAVDDETYRVSDLQFPNTLNIPGLANVTFDDITLDGTWSTTDRSYTALQAELTDLRVEVGQGGQGELALGRFAFDVQKEPDETDTESRINLTFGEIEATGFAPEDVIIGEIQASLSANGERPVDLYSLLREVVVMAGLRDGGVRLRTLGESLLGDTYDTVALDLQARDFSVIDPRRAEDRFFRAEGLQARLDMTDVSPGDWGDAALSVNLNDIKQQNLVENDIFEVERAVIRLAGADLPVDDIFAAFNTLQQTGRPQPIRVSDLLDGLLEFGRLELSTEGDGLFLEVRNTVNRNDTQVEETDFITAYDSWGMRLALADFDSNNGTITSQLSLDGGTFSPGPGFLESDLRHVNAWFPIALEYGGQLSNLNEAFLKQIFQDVLIENINEPIEVVFPLALYASAAVFEVNVEGNQYQTALFDIEQTSEYRIFPAKIMSLLPVEGKTVTTMTGFDAMLEYFEEVRKDEIGSDFGRNAQGFSMLKSVLTVLRNLGTQTEDGAVLWEIEKRDAERSEIAINGTVFSYPNLGSLLPAAFYRSVFR